MPQKEKRKHPRIHCLNLLAYVCMNENSEIVRQGMAKTLDVSEGGILMETHVPIDPQYTVSLTLGLKDELTDIKGKVAHFRTNGNGRFQSGIQFVETQRPTGRVLRKFIEAFRKEHGGADQGASVQTPRKAKIPARIMELVSHISEDQQRALLNQLEAYEQGTAGNTKERPVLSPWITPLRIRSSKASFKTSVLGGFLSNPAPPFLWERKSFSPSHPPTARNRSRSRARSSGATGWASG